MKNILAISIFAISILALAQNPKLHHTNIFQHHDISNMTQSMDNPQDNNYSLQEYVNSLNFSGFKLDEENPTQINKDKKLVGKTYLASLIVKKFPNVKIRFLARNSIVTMEYNSNRVNIMFDDFNAIVRITVG